MKRFFILGVFLIFSSLSNQVVANVINFLQADFDQIAAQAKQTSKPFFVYFYGEWCPSCQVMQQTTFQDQQVVELANMEILAVKADINSTLGKKWQTDFAVTCLPTTIFFDKNGNQLERYELPFTGTGFLKILNKHLYGKPLVYANQQELPDFSLPKISPKGNTSSITKKYNNSNTSTISYSSNHFALGDNVLRDPVFLMILRKHLNNLKTLELDANNINTNSEAVLQENFLSKLSIEELESIAYHPASSEQIKVQKYRQTCQRLLADPSFVKELIKYFSHLENVISQNLNQDKVASNRNASPEFQLSKTTIHGRSVLTNTANTANHIIVTDQPKANTQIHLEGTYFLQMGYFEKIENAQKLITRLKRAFPNIEVYYKEELVSGQYLQRVMLGNFIYKNDAKKYAKQILKKGFKSFVKRNI